MPKTSLFVFAKIKPKSEYLSEARNAILGIIEQTCLESGCRQFVLHEGKDDDCLYLYEEWEDESMLAQHYEQPYTKAVFESYEQWLAVPVEVTKMTLPNVQ